MGIWSTELGATVMVPIPDVDRGRADLRNIKAVVIKVHDDGMYELGTEHGILKNLYSRNQFSPCIEKFIDISDVPTDQIKISLREAAKSSSVGLGQGFFKCHCTTGCQSKRCKCFK